MTLDQKLDRVLQKVEQLERHSRPLETWVSGSWIMELTGWGAKKLQQAREGNIIRWRKKKGKDPEYLLQSVPDEFKIK